MWRAAGDLIEALQDQGRIELVRGVQGPRWRVYSQGGAQQGFGQPAVIHSTGNLAGKIP